MIYALLLFFLTGSLTGTHGSSGTAENQTKPNIILIMADDLGYAELGSYGQEIIQTPHLDRMAEEGMRFTDFYSGATVCKPSRESIMTGMHTGHTFVRGNFRTGTEGDFAVPFDKIERKTIAEYAKQAGYATFMIGKWGLGGAGSGSGPNARGFDYSLGYLSQINAHNYFPPFLWENEEMIRFEENEDGAQNMYSHHLFVDKTLEILENTSTEEPFFMYLPYTLPHGRFEIPDDAPYTNEEWPQQQKNIAAMITLLDRDVGRIMQLLQDKGMAENTLVLFTSDNGPTSAATRYFNSNGPLRGIKRDPYEGGIRVPLIAWWPGTIRGGQTSGHISAAWDILPTVAELAGLESVSDIDGISFVPELLGQPQPEHEFLYWEFYTYNYGWGNPDNSRARNWLQHRAVRYGKWKAVKNDITTGQNEAIELYDLENDPGETTDVAGDHPKIMQKIEAYMIATYNTNPYFPYQP